MKVARRISYCLFWLIIVYLLIGDPLGVPVSEALFTGYSQHESMGCRQ